MLIAIAGGSGFIGGKLAQALRAHGHRVLIGSRTGNEGDRIEIDFARPIDSEQLARTLLGVDAVVNAVGILREHGTQSFERIHFLGPRSLFDACVRADVPRVIQVSALGAERGSSGYFISKRRADDYLMTLPLQWTIVRPALVYGPGGTSAAMFGMMASLPIIPLPGDGQQQLQPVHIDDLIDAMVRMIEQSVCMRECVQIAGPQRLSYRQYLETLRTALGLSRAWFISIPRGLMRAAAWLGSFSKHSMMDRQTLDMLEAGNVGDPDPLRRVLEREPRYPGHFITQERAADQRLRARLSWLLPLLRYSMAAVWIWTGIVSMGLYSTRESYALLAQVGVHGTLASILLYGAAALDLALGLAVLLFRNRRPVWLAQIAVMLTFTVIISIWLPQYWLHPYGPILKNLPMLAGIIALYILEPEVAWNT
ncbi:MAG: SDR family oxidoreductase [Povalibacter sp.]